MLEEKVLSLKPPKPSIDSGSSGPAGGVSVEQWQQRVEQLFVDARNDVYYYLQSLGVPPAQAQELTQEVFLRLYVEFRKGQQIENARAWVFRVAHNLGLKTRSRESRWFPMNDEMEATLMNEDKSPEDNLLLKERVLLLRRALATLSPQQRQCLHLRAEGLRYREIAETIGVSVSTVGEFIQRGLRRLRNYAHEQ